jgi:hypothetical protein
MRETVFSAGGLARAGLFACLILGNSSVGYGDESAPPATAPAAAAAPAAAPAAEAPSLWANVPPLSPTPRAGWFFVPPTGPGYYSLRDVISGNYRESPPKNPFPPLSPTQAAFYDADYRFLDDPNYTERDVFLDLKRMHLGCDWMLSIGGEERVRYMNEIDSRLSGKDNDYTLIRSRVYADVWYRDWFRVYVEYLDAQITGQDLSPLATDRDHSDLLDLFADVKIGEFGDHPAYVRVGRQELLYGSQRLVSPLDWANTRRTFQGVKGFWHGDNFDIDAFWVQPLVLDPSHFDAPDSGKQFAGLWNTYRPAKGQAIDVYYLYYDQTRPVGTKPVKDVRGGLDVSTFGSSYSGDWNHILWDFEGMYQFGDYAGHEISAGAYTTGLGYQLADVPMNPQAWIYYDYASGDHSGGKDGHGTFNQLFPFGHYYFGYLDLVGRQNIHDLNMQLACYPANWILAYCQFHVFRLDSSKDALYNAAGTVLRKDPTGKAGTDVGDELDFAVNFHLTRHQDIYVGYSKLFAGDFIKATGPGGSPELAYVQYSFKW